MLAGAKVKTDLPKSEADKNILVTNEESGTSDCTFRRT